MSQRPCLLLVAQLYAAIVLAAARRHGQSMSHQQTATTFEVATTAQAWCNSMDKALSQYVSLPSRQLWSSIARAVANGGTPAPVDEVTTWMARKCNATMWMQYNALAPFPSCRGRAVPMMSRCPCSRNEQDSATSHHIAIMMGVTSRNVANPSTSSLALFTLALPSIAKTVECGFRYTVLVGYDAGDAFYDRPAGQAALAEWFDRHVHKPLHRRGINIELIPVRVANPLAKPGPVFNAVARHAHAINADFFYRVNDDTLMLTPWTSAFVCALCSLGPPHGVVGPVETEHADILTHDFVHKTHLSIFDDYYPPSLTDWWMDDWISKVYGPNRSLRVTSVKTLHMTKTHGQRYAVDKTHERLLQPLLESGRMRIRNYAASQSTSDGVQSKYDDLDGTTFGDVTAVR